MMIIFNHIRARQVLLWFPMQTMAEQNDGTAYANAEDDPALPPRRRQAGTLKGAEEQFSKKAAAVEKYILSDVQELEPALPPRYSKKSAGPEIEIEGAAVTEHALEPVLPPRKRNLSRREPRKSSPVNIHQAGKNYKGDDGGTIGISSLVEPALPPRRSRKKEDDDDDDDDDDDLEKKLGASKTRETC